MPCSEADFPKSAFEMIPIKKETRGESIDEKLLIREAIVIEEDMPRNCKIKSEGER